MKNLKKKLNQLNQLFNSNKIITMDKNSKWEFQDYLMMLQKKTLKLTSILLLRLKELTSWQIEILEIPKDYASLNSTTNKGWIWQLPITDVNTWEDGWTSKRPKLNPKDKVLLEGPKDSHKVEIVLLSSLETFPSALLNHPYKKHLKNMETLPESELLKIRKETVEDSDISISRQLKKPMLH